MDGLIVQVRQFRQPFPQEDAARIEPAGLRQRIEYAEVGHRVGPRGGAPLPAAIVGGQVAVHQLRHEPGFAQAPIDQQVFGQEHGGHHAQPVVHPAQRQQLPHGGARRATARRRFRVSWAGAWTATGRRPAGAGRTRATAVR
ncbi:hypothetical protein G6F31_019524 [Rhizopus arrhizus]|nr:hypothetical protein G6F31_019524 [Rhizopus arrhizus]